MSSELEEIGEYVLRILERMKETESRVQKLEDSVNSIGKVIDEATEESQPEASTSNVASPIPFRLWVPLNAIKWLGVFLAIFFIADIRGRMSVAAWAGVIPSDFPFWNMIDGAIAGVSLAVAAGIEIFFFWRERRKQRSSPLVLEVEEAKQVQTSEEAKESEEAPAETEETVIDNEVEEATEDSPLINLEETEETSLESPPIEENE
jgi:hypothetical protein